MKHWSQARYHWTWYIHFLSCLVFLLYMFWWEDKDYCCCWRYNLMLHCWSLSPELRPSFSKIVARLECLLQSSEDYLDISSQSGQSDHQSAPTSLLSLSLQRRSSSPAPRPSSPSQMTWRVLPCQTVVQWCPWSTKMINTYSHWQRRNLEQDKQQHFPTWVIKLSSSQGRSLN